MSDQPSPSPSPLPYAEVIGDPIAQSKSPAIHNFWLNTLKLGAEYRACRVGVDELGAYLDARRNDPNWRGCNVTMPLKQAIIPLLDSLEEGAARVGAVNIVVPGEAGALIGANSDVAGFLEPLRDALEESHYFRMARVLGTGGAARAIITGLVEQGFTIVLAGRNTDKARALLDSIDPQGEHHVAPLAHFAAPTDFAFDDREDCFDLIVNASPLGMAGQPELRFDFSHAPPGAVVYDIVTDPLDTAFLRGARAAGLETFDGLSMLIGQAAIGFRRFFGQSAPRDDGDAALRALLTR